METDCRFVMEFWEKTSAIGSRISMTAEPVRILAAAYLAVSIGGSHKSDGIKAGRIKGDHGCHQKNQNERSQRQRLYNGGDGRIKIPCGRIQPHHIEFS